METESKARGRKAELITAARMHLEMEYSLGVDRLRFQPKKRAPRKRPIAAAAPAADSSKAAALKALENELNGCCRCGLSKDRTHLVFGVGNPDAELMFVGEAPGRDEDEQGIPFVGRAGQLLTDIIRSIGLTRDDVYIANICKCRPPQNRTPTPEESALCFPYLRRQIEIIQPRIIVVLGNVPMRMFLQAEQGITKIRGQWGEWNGILVMPTYHPAYLLRNPSAKREVWTDMQEIWRRMKEMGLKVGPLGKKK